MLLEIESGYVVSKFGQEDRGIYFQIHSLVILMVSQRHFCVITANSSTGLPRRLENGQVSEVTQNFVNNICEEKTVCLDFEALYEIFHKENSGKLTRGFTDSAILKFL